VIPVCSGISLGDGYDDWAKIAISEWSDSPGHSTNSPLAMILIYRDFQSFDGIAELLSGQVTNAFCNDSRQLFGRRIDDRQNDAVFVREYPAFVAKASGCLTAFAGNPNFSMVSGQQNVVIKRSSDRQDRVAKRNKVSDIAVFIERSLDDDTNAVVVTVESFADVARKRNEVR